MLVAMKPPYPEKTVQTQCEELLEFGRWTWFHPLTAISRKGKYLTAYTGHKGFPDIIAVRAARPVVGELNRILFIECKGRDARGRLGKLAPDQIAWRQEIVDAGIEYYLVTPDDVEGLAEVLA
jgi:hypothetical protein